MTQYIIGADVSEFQTNDPAKSTYAYVFVRTSFGTSIPLDPKHDEHVKAARSAGQLVGHYHFLRPGNIIQQANNFVKNSAAKPGELLVCDWESYNGTIPTNAEKDQFIKAVKALMPHNKVLLYCNVNNWLNNDTTGYLGDGLWIASYTTSLPAIKTPWVVWQYTQNGGLDKDRARFASIADMKAWANELNIVVPPVVVPPTTVTQTVDGIILGPYKTSGTKIKWRDLYHNNHVQATTTCYCVTQAVAVAEAKLKKLGVIKESLDFWQFGYGQAAAASADTHAQGGVIDTVQIDDVTWQVLREVGFTASWYRGPGSMYGNFSTKHIHAVLSGCPHVSAGAKAQIDSPYQGIKSGKNGLANGANDYAPPAVKAVKYITWQNAFKKYVQTSTTPTNSSGDQTVAQVFHYNTSSYKQKFNKAGVYQALFFKPGSCSFAYGPGLVQGTVNLTISGLGDNDTVYLRTVAYDFKSDGKTSVRRGEGPLSEIHGMTPGWQWGPSIPIMHNISTPATGYSTRRLRVEVACTNPDAVIEAVDIQGTKS